MTFIIEKKQVESEEVVDVTCNRCGKSIYINGQGEGIRFHAHWGYESKHDLQQWTGDLCQDCSEEFERWLQATGGKIDKMVCTVDGQAICTLEEYERGDYNGEQG